MYKITIEITKDKAEVSLGFDDIQATETWVPCVDGYCTVLDEILSQISDRLEEKANDGLPTDGLVESLEEINSAVVGAMHAIAKLEKCEETAG